MNSKKNISYSYKREDNKQDYERFFKKKDQTNKSNNNKHNQNQNQNVSFNMEQQYFPVLVNSTPENTKTSTTNSNSNIQSFAEMASLPKIVETVIEEVPPGKLSIQYDKKTRTIKSIYGEKTPEFILYENREKIKNSVHYRMNKAIYQINKNQEKRIQYYDDVHGEGAYEEMFQKYMYEFEDDEEEEIPSDDSETE